MSMNVIIYLKIQRQSRRLKQCLIKAGVSTYLTWSVSKQVAQVEGPVCLSVCAVSSS